MLVNAFKTAWGVGPEEVEDWLRDVKAKGYKGVELNPACYDDDKLSAIKQLAGELSLDFIMHDMWTVEESIEFYKGTLVVDAELGLAGMVCHETHRNRSCYHPLPTAQILRQVPELRLTSDVSHWVLVCERLLDEHDADIALMKEIVPNCPEPDHESFAPEKAFFYSFWRKVIDFHRAAGQKETFAFVPEYGPYPYHSIFSPRTNSAIADSEAAALKIVLNRA
ncbi:hypothetical protein IAR55_000709 [Kwoniella newhampshirensis]|uniref:Xylose isomerase-like TIM barrel domain-containing protein n=1 Tax=Kwoniella newhampshirensis TaxID=1651941 RepID=A0AAW0Z7K1_9TREE